MGVEVTVLSKSMVVPTPRPDESRELLRLQLTGFDLRLIKFPPFRVLLLYDASAQENLIVNQFNERLRESLSRALTDYYPFAGRFVQDEGGLATVDCNDAGVEFVEASAPITVRELRNYNMADLYQHFAQPIPCTLQDFGTWHTRGPLFGAQVTHLKCGGYAVGFVYFHGLVDGITLWQFIKSWAEVARGERISLLPNFSSRENVINLASESESDNSDWIKYSLPKAYMKRLSLSGNPFPSSGDSKGPPATALNSTTLHILFDVPMQKKLKEKVLQDPPHGPTFSAYVVISAHVWRAITRARLLAYTEETRYFNSIDCRKRWLELPPNYFGNAVLDAVAVTTVRELLGNGISYAANLLHKTIADFTAHHIKSQLTIMEKEKKESYFLFDFRPFADVSAGGSTHFPGLEHFDFGWGPPFANIAILLKFTPPSAIVFAAKHNDGTIEIQFKLPQDAATRLQEDADFMSCISSVTAVTLG